MIQMFMNGIWKPMPHDNFLINVANKIGKPLRPLEAHLHTGDQLRVGRYVFREVAPKEGVKK